MSQHEFAIFIELKMRELYCKDKKVAGNYLLDADLIEQNLFWMSIILLVKMNIKVDEINKFMCKYYNIDFNQEMNTELIEILNGFGFN